MTLLPTVAATDLSTAYLTGDAIRVMVQHIEQGLTLSDEARATLYRGLRPIVEPVVRQALEQDMEATR